MGSKLDLPIMNECIKVLKEFEVDYEVKIVSAHRTPDFMFEYSCSARNRGIIIAGAGGTAHLSGIVANFTELPVIGVPIQSKTLKGLDSLLSIVQMPVGVPVATVAINGAKNAELLAIQILGVNNKNIAQKLKEYRENMKNTVLKESEVGCN